jgi:hypothetical protein
MTEDLKDKSEKAILYETYVKVENLEARVNAHSIERKEDSRNVSRSINKLSEQMHEFKADILEKINDKINPISLENERIKGKIAVMSAVIALVTSIVASSTAAYIVNTISK